MKALLLIAASTSFVAMTVACGKIGTSANPAKDYKLTGEMQAQAGADPRTYLPQDKEHVVIKEVPKEVVKTVYVPKEVPKEVTKIEYVPKEVEKIVEKYTVKEVPVNVDGRLFIVDVKEIPMFYTGQMNQYTVRVRALQGKIKFTANLEGQPDGMTLAPSETPSKDENTQLYTLSWNPNHSLISSKGVAYPSKVRVIIEPTEVHDEDAKREEQIKQQLKVSTKAYDIGYVVVLGNTAQGSVAVKGN